MYGDFRDYDEDGYPICYCEDGCYRCEQAWREREREERIAEKQRGVDWSQFPMQIHTKVNSKCASCEFPIPAGSPVMWDGPATGKVRCLPGQCKPRGWERYPLTCPFCDEPYCYETDSYDGDGTWMRAATGMYGCGTEVEGGVRSIEERSKRSSGCQTIQRLKKRLAGEKPSNMIDINDLI